MTDIGNMIYKFIEAVFSFFMLVYFNYTFYSSLAY